MSKIVWTPESGWTNDGPEATIRLDEQGRIRIDAVPTEPSAAYVIGQERGTAAATWVEIADADDARRLLEGTESTELIMELCPSPLSGEWAGESITELSDETGLNLEDEETASDFEQGFADGFFAELERRATAMLPTSADILSNAGFTGYWFDAWNYQANRAVETPEAGDTVYVADLNQNGTPDLFEMPVTLWGDYCGSDCGRSNYRSLVRDYPDTFVFGSDSMGASFLLVPGKVSLELAEELAEIGSGLAEQYPLYDEEDHSMLEMELAEEAWDAWVRSDLTRALRDAIIGRCPSQEYDECVARADEIVDSLEEDTLRDRFYTFVSDTPQPYYLESANSVVFPSWDDVVADLAEHFAADAEIREAEAAAERIALSGQTSFPEIQAET